MFAIFLLGCPELCFFMGFGLWTVVDRLIHAFNLTLGAGPKQGDLPVKR
jgi:hypothetical protein